MKPVSFLKSLPTAVLFLAAAAVAHAEPIRGEIAGENEVAVYAFKIDRSRQVDLLMASSELDSYLHLLAVGEGEGVARFTMIAQDDDSGGNLDARINRTLEPGEYRLIARALDGDGAFTLSARSYKPSEVMLIDSVVGDVANGRPAPEGGDPGVDAFGPQPAVATPIRVVRAGQLQVDVLALDRMDALLMLAAPDGSILEINDDSLTIQHSRINRQVAPGNYTAWVTMSSGDPQHAGEFVLNATFRLIEDESELQLKESPEDKDDVVKVIWGGDNDLQEPGLLQRLLGAAIGGAAGEGAAVEGRALHGAAVGGLINAEAADDAECMARNRVRNRE